MPAQGRPRIALLAAPETSASVLYGLYDVLLSVGPMWPDMLAAETAENLLDVSIVAVSKEPFRCFGNILVEPHAALAEIHDVDAVIVCDMYTPIDTAPRGRFRTEVEWLRRMHARGALLATVCTGSLLLAEAGLLDGRSCAGHWAYADLFRATYPRIRFDTRAILDLSSEDSRMITAGGVTSWQDLAVHLIARFCSPTEARLAGLGKEVRDAFGPGDADWSDWQATRAGVRCAAAAADVTSIITCCENAQPGTYKDGDPPL